MMKRPGVNVAREIGLLRRYRCPGERDLGLGSLLAEEAARARRLVRASDASGAAWEAAAPEWLRSASKVVGLRGGVLTVRVTNAAARFRADRWLRGGGEALVVRASAKPMHRVKVVL